MHCGRSRKAGIPGLVRNQQCAEHLSAGWLVGADLPTAVDAQVATKRERDAEPESMISVNSVFRLEVPIVADQIASSSGGRRRGHRSRTKAPR